MEHPVEEVTTSTEAQDLYLFSERPKLRRLQENPNNKGFLQKDALGEALPRAEKFDDLIMVDHKVLNEGGESRDNHQHAGRVQDLATQWIQNQSFTGDGEEHITILGIVASTESNIRWNLVKSCEELSWNHRTTNTLSIRDERHR